MEKASSDTGKFSELRITREVADFVVLDASNNPDHQESTIWPSVIHDPRFKNIVHAALEYGSEQFNGLQEPAPAKYAGFVEGVSFAIEAMRQAIKESEADQEFERLLKNPSE